VSHGVYTAQHEVQQRMMLYEKKPKDNMAKKINVILLF
jgi:hypothetical protein